MSELVTHRRRVTGPVEEREIEGRAYLVAPVVAVKEGVLNRLLLPLDELSHYYNAWEDAPVPVRHPVAANGLHVSACTTDQISRAVGRFYDVRMDGPALKGNIYLDIAKAEALGGDAETALTALRNGEPMDVSTAYFCDIEPTSGTWNGTPYDGIQRNLRRDHLALLPGEQGACSWEDGCGVPRVNETISADDPGLANGRLVRHESRLMVYNDGQWHEAAAGAAITDGELSMTKPILIDSPANGPFLQANIELSLDDTMRRVADAWYASYQPNDPMPGEPYRYVWEVWPDFAVVRSEGKFYRYPYTLADDGTVSFGAPEEVYVVYQPVVPAANEKPNGGATMTEAQKPPTGNAGCGDCPDGTPAPKTNSAEGVQTPAAAPVEAPVSAELQALLEVVEGYGGVDAFKDALTQFKANSDAERDGLIAALSANAGHAFDQADLAGMSTPMLRKLDASLRPADYSGRGLPVANRAGGDWEPYVAPGEGK